MQRFSRESGCAFDEERELNEKSMKELCGNCMHLQTQAAWMLYVLCNVAEVDQRDGEVDGGGDDWGEMW